MEMNNEKFNFCQTNIWYCSFFSLTFVHFGFTGILRTIPACIV